MHEMIGPPGLYILWNGNWQVATLVQNFRDKEFGSDQRINKGKERPIKRQVVQPRFWRKLDLKSCQLPPCQKIPDIQSGRHHERGNPNPPPDDKGPKQNVRPTDLGKKTGMHMDYPDAGKRQQSSRDNSPAGK